VQVERGYIGFESGRTKSLGFRKVQLESFLKLLTENYEDIRKAVMRDLNKSKWEGETTLGRILDKE